MPGSTPKPASAYLPIFSNSGLSAYSSSPSFFAAPVHRVGRMRLAERHGGVEVVHLGLEGGLKQRRVEVRRAEVP